MKLPAGSGCAFDSSAVSPIPSLKVPEITGSEEQVWTLRDDGEGVGIIRVVSRQRDGTATPHPFDGASGEPCADRTGVALLGAIAVVAVGREPLARVWSAVDMPTLYLLFAMMVISAQFRLGGFYTALTRAMGQGDHSPAVLLALVTAAAGGLSAVVAAVSFVIAVAPPATRRLARPS